MIVVLKAYADIDFFIPGAKIGQSFEVDIPQGAPIKAALEKLGIPSNAYGFFLNGRYATEDKILNPNDLVYLLEAISGG
ncbi:MAG: MoaD/ThiS family protein [Desulfotomaculaceae bacterium]|nr:MoaD/ThiS family protein [Desulfotomaculaceae bacterium]